MSDELGQAVDIEQSYRVKRGLYLLGSLERGVTVYKQQVRAHNLAWALFRLREDEDCNFRNIAIVGGGIAGLTVAACFLSLDAPVRITLFEQRWDLCPIQQGCDTRWVHPRIYDWPVRGSRSPRASLPVLNWSEGRASDVARSILRAFSSYVGEFDKEKSMSVYLGLSTLRVTAASNSIEWIGRRASIDGDYFRTGGSEGCAREFDAIILASGFGIEAPFEGRPMVSYWRNESLGQPMLDGSVQWFLISGYGDGALTDLFRLTIERFRQDTIVYELFGYQDIDTIEQELTARLKAQGENLFSLFREIEEGLLKRAMRALERRIRKDTRVVLHIKGRNANVRTFSEIFGPSSSILSRMLTYLLYRLGAFALSFESLATAIHDYSVPNANVLCRYGPNTMGHIQTMLVDFDSVETRLRELKVTEPQRAVRLWSPSAFRALVE